MHEALKEKKSCSAKMQGSASVAPRRWHQLWGMSDVCAYVVSLPNAVARRWLEAKIEQEGGEIMQ